MKRLLATGAFVLLGAFLVHTTAARAAQSTAGPNPPAARAARHAVAAPLANDTVLTFSEFPLGTSITTQYQPQGIVFGGDSPFTAGDGSNPTSPVLSGSPQFQGAIEGSFVDPATGVYRTVDHFGLDVGYFDDLGSTRLTWYAANGSVLGSAANQDYGIYHFDVRTPGIARWRIEIISYEGAGYAIDNLTFPPKPPGPAWHEWVSLGSSIVSYPDCKPDAAGIGCWARSFAGRLVLNDGPPTGPRSWQDLGGSIAGSPTCIVRSGRTDCFASTSLNRLAWITYNGATWGSWINLGANATGQPYCLLTGTSTIDCYAGGTDNAVRRWSYNGASWKAPVKITGAKTVNRVTCVQRSGTDCFYRDGSANAWTFHVSTTGTVGKPKKIGSGFGLAPTCINNSGKLDCFAQSTQKNLIKGYFNGSTWAVWKNLGGNVVGDATCTKTSVTTNPDFACYWVNSAGHMVERLRTGGVWQVEQDLGGSIQLKPACVLAGGRKDCFARGLDNQLWQKSFY